MSARWDGRELLPPIAPEAPCGASLDDSVPLAAIEGARLFGRVRPFDSPPEPGDRWKPPDWLEFKTTTLDTLQRSRDLRVLANLAVALLRTDGLGAFLQTLPVASHWLGTYWAEVYPRLEDGDATLRRSALNCFGDSMAVVDGVRRLPLVSSRQHGTFSLRDIDVATGQLTPKPGEPRVDEAQIAAAFAAMAADQLAALHESVVAAQQAIRDIDVARGTNSGPESVTALEALTGPLGRIERVLRTHRGSMPVAAGADTAAAGAAGMPAPAVAVGAIHSREDAIRALDAVAAYFRRHEPSSPIPMLVERARRLVSRSFLEVLADLVPDAVPQARSVGGVPEES
jgi:type VI secretion system protein ImpA